MTLSRRTLIKTSLAPAILAAPGIRAARAQGRDTVTIVMGLEPPMLDPTATPAQAAREIGLQNIFEGLMKMDRQGRILPALAENVTVAPDGLRYEFRLREGVKFHNDVTLTSEHVKYSLDRGRDPQATHAQKWIFTQIANVETPDARTVRVTMSQPMSRFLFGLTLGDACIFEPSSMANNRTNPIGTGPYKFVRWQRGSMVELERFDGHRDRANLRMRRAIFRFSSDPNAQMAAIQAGDVDALTNFGAYEAVERIRADRRFAVVVGATEGETILGLNNQKVPFNDVRVRRAISHAIDRNAVIQGAMSGFGSPIGSHFSPAHPAYVDLTGTYPHDVARARALLTEAGHPNGFACTFKVPPPVYARRSSEIIAAQLAQVGIRASIEPMEFAPWLDQVFARRDFDMTIIAHTEPLDIDIYSRPNYYFGYRNPEFNALIARIEATVDEAARTEMYRQAQRMLAADAVNGFLFVLPKIGVWNANLVGMWENWPLPANPLAELSWRA